MTGIHLNAERLQSPGEGHSQHSVGLLGLSVGGIIVVTPFFELEISEIKTTCPVAGHVYDACASY